VYKKEGLDVYKADKEKTFEDSNGVLSNRELRFGPEVLDIADITT
jgi:hypothetical protein